MSDRAPVGSLAFKEMERSGWHEKADAYDDLLGRVTRAAMGPLLDATGVVAGSMVLDVACGPGYGAAEATRRGATAVGIDFAENMIALARHNHPEVDICHGDGEDLAFDDASFDAVICPFGILHMAHPVRAMGEAFRVLKPGGRYAFTVWAGPDKHDFFGLVLPAIQGHCDMSVPLPEAPPIFHYSDHDVCRRTLAEVGFDAVDVVDLPLVFEAGSPRRVLQLLHRATVRTSALLDLQTPEVRAKVDADILATLEKRPDPSRLDLGFPAVMASGRKPLG